MLLTLILFWKSGYRIVWPYMLDNVSHVNKLQPLTSDIWISAQSAPGEREYIWIEIYSCCLTKLAQFVSDVI
jgi:hypothetical protein